MTQTLIQFGINKLQFQVRTLYNTQTQNSQVVVEYTHGGLESLDIYDVDKEWFIWHKYSWHQLLVLLLLIKLGVCH